MFTNFRELEEACVVTKRKARIVVPTAGDQSAVEAIHMGVEKGIVEGILVGSKEQIRFIFRELGYAVPDRVQIIDARSEEEVMALTVDLVRRGEANMILKGRMNTSSLLKHLLSSSSGLEKGGLLSDVFIFEDPLRPDGKLVGITDGGINVAPRLEQKRKILENGVEVYHRLGVACPKVACLCATEVVTTSMPATQDAKALTEMNESGELAGCLVYGPLAFDNAVSRWCARYKGIESQVAGNPDILLAPCIEVGNAVAKAIQYYCAPQVGHVIIGAEVPILINSRVDKAQAKLNSILLGIVAGLGLEKV